ncbi:MAG: hypothetical protein RLZZ488_2666 [Pseudomonadota bacterium]|jgi:hypothetical protein
MKSSVVSVLVSLCTGASVSAFASPCTEGNQSRHRLLKRCTIRETPDLVSGAMIQRVDVCLSKIEKSGGPFGGDMIPWFFSHFEITPVAGEKQTFTFDSPDGRHNFRSVIDYSVIDFTDGFFYMESHRTKYPDNSRKGYVDLHTVTFDQNTKVLRFDYSKRNGVMFGRWEDKISFEAVCAE